MKRILFAICLLLCLTGAEAQTIHWITFIDTTDPKVGKIDVTGRDVLYTHFVNEVNAALTSKGYTSRIYDYYGAKDTPENCKSAIQNLKVTSEDIIVFYYIGHGGRPNTDESYIKQHPYPQMCFAQHDQSKYIPLEWVYNQLTAKGARLAVTIGMCCNSIGNISIKAGPSFSPTYGVTNMSDNKVSRIQDLFLGVKGSVLATSASPKQYSGCFETELGQVDCYTTVLCDIFREKLDDYPQTLTWDVLLGSISKIIDKNTDGDQTPIHETHLSAAAIPAAKQQSVPTGSKNVTEEQQTETGSEGDLNILSKYFDYMINANNDPEKRLDVADELKEIFAPGAIVKVMSADGEMVVDLNTAAKFLKRISSSRILLKVAPVSFEYNSSKRITTLKVKEYYKK